MPKSRAQPRPKSRKINSTHKKKKRRPKRGLSIGQHFARTTRTVLAQLPGSAITQPVADFVFRLFGVTNTNLDLKGATIGNGAATIYSTGMYGSFVIISRMFMATDPKIGIVLPPATKESNGTYTPTSYNPMVQNVCTQYTCAQIRRLRVKASGTGPMGSVSGTWAMGFVSFKSSAQRDLELSTLKVYSSFEYVMSMERSVCGSVREPLLLEHKFSYSDGISGLPCALDEPLGLVVIAYEDVMRSSGSNFSPEDFQCSVDCSADIRFLGRDSKDYWDLNNSTIDPLTAISAVVRAPNGVFSFDAKSQIKTSRGSVTLTGNFSRISAGGRRRPYPSGGPVSLVAGPSTASPLSPVSACVKALAEQWEVVE